MLSAPSFLKYAPCNVFLRPKKKLGKVLYVSHARFANWERLRNGYLLRPPSSLLRCARFLLPNEKSCEVFLIMQCLRAGQSTTNAICSAPLLFWLCNDFHCPRKNQARFCWIRLGLQAGQSSADAICYALLDFWMAQRFALPKEDLCNCFFELCMVCELGKVPQMLSVRPPSLLNYAQFLPLKTKLCRFFTDCTRFASWARLRRCYLLRPLLFLNFAWKKLSEVFWILQGLQDGQI